MIDEDKQAMREHELRMQAIAATVKTFEIAVLAIRENGAGMDDLGAILRSPELKQRAKELTNGKH